LDAGGLLVGTLLGLARSAALGLALALAGCVTTENSLSQNDIAGMKLTGVTVSFAPEAAIQWEDGIRAYATAKSITDDQIATATNTPEGKAYVRNMLAPHIKAGVERTMAGQLVGTRPVRLDIVVKSFVIASALQRIVIGGGRGMVADANLVDARTGALIIAHPDLRAVQVVGNGIVGTAVQAAIDSASQQNPVDKVVEIYGGNYRQWLLKIGA
jgi:pectin methylesterase-like acyl-CoA thioesterase